MEKKFYVTASSSAKSCGCTGVIYALLILSFVLHVIIENVSRRWMAIILLWLISIFIAMLPELIYGKPYLLCTEDRLIYNAGWKSWEIEISKINRVVYTVIEGRGRPTSHYLLLRIDSGESEGERICDTFDQRVNFIESQDIALGKKDGYDFIEIHDWIAERNPEAARGFVSQRDFW